jgi:hypothetical protein
MALQHPEMNLQMSHWSIDIALPWVSIASQVKYVIQTPPHL